MIEGSNLSSCAHIKSQEDVHYVFRYTIFRKCSVYHMCRSRKFCQKGSNSGNFFFVLVNERGSK